ncbi:MAG: PhoH family protein [Bacteroidota bacterium]
MSEIVLSTEGVDALELFGARDNKLNIIKKAYPEVRITHRGTSLKISGEKKMTQKVKYKIETLIRLLKDNDELSKHTIMDIVEDINPYLQGNGKKDSANVIVYGNGGKKITARTRNQKRLVEYSDMNDVVFAIGPAGTGKTYTAVALAVKALKNKLVRKIILTRPAVEAGESLGFLPGDLKEKIDPYLRPLYDALEDMLPPDKLEQFMNNRTIEVAPLAFMRGRTLDNAFIILDEAQNTTSAQLKMFLTRLGPNAKCIITGDLSQVDLPRSQKSGLRDATELLSNIDGIATLFLTAEDVVRHRLVKAIIRAYDRNRNGTETEEQKADPTYQQDLLTQVVSNV